ncbi:MAG TPA: ribonuclease E/G, partial [Chromatiales bacterium]|nr:ribonuclease E/G [Chromatiales bacterium]
IEAAFHHELSLPSGGSIVIDHTEALISIDINSSRATKGGDIEETALNTNLEAADEIARQLRIRDLGGLIVIDFIDMTPSRNQREVENRLKEAVKRDRARIQIGRISRFGLLEMSRQRLRPSLGESSHETCPRCSGLGSIRNVESLALSILRVIEEDAMKENTARIVCQLPVNVATYLLNEKRNAVTEIESRQNIRLILIANPSMETPNFEVTRQRREDVTDEQAASYEMVKEVEKPDITTAFEPQKPAEKPAVKGVMPASPVPPRTPGEQKEEKEKDKEGRGFIKQIFSSLFGANHKEAPSEAKTETGTDTAKPQAKQPARKSSGRSRSGQSSGRGRGRQRRGGQQASGNRRGGQQRQGQQQGQAVDKAQAPQESQDGKTEGKQETATQTDNRGRAPGKERERTSRRRNGRGQGRRQGSKEKATAGNPEQNGKTPAEGTTPRPDPGSAPPKEDRPASEPAAATPQQPATERAAPDGANTRGASDTGAAAPSGGGKRGRGPKDRATAPDSGNASVLLREKSSPLPASPSATAGPAKPDFPQSPVHSAVSSSTADTPHKADRPPSEPKAVTKDQQ